MQLPGYTLRETLAPAGRTARYRALRNIDQRPVLLKVMDPQHSRAKDLEQLRQEYEIGQRVSSSDIVRPLALEMVQGMPALVLEDFSGRSLDDLLGEPMPLDRFLPLAIRIAAAVAKIHDRSIVHKDLKPENILVNTVAGDVRVADFSLASRVPKEQPPADPPRIIEGSLPYLSPEQTGWTNRAVDSRTDLYSLGITFYRMLTGQLPFEASDPVEWVHCHVARVPRSPSELVPEVSRSLADVVLKLLSKMPEDRYQTARGLQRDLEHCLRQWIASRTIEPFALGEHDATGRLQISQKLHGRESEIARLLEAYSRVVASGTPELFLVSGCAGIGKSSLVRELYRPTVRLRGLFVSGKFEPNRRDIPYSTILSIFRELVLEILTETEERIADWRQRLLGALGANAQLIADVIPPIELVIGKQPPVSELLPPEAQTRFRTTLRQLVGVFARKERPLALFLDDLHWADSASIELLKELVSAQEGNFLMVIGAYRENEVTSSHALALALEEVRKTRARISNIVLGPLSREHLASFVCEALRTDREHAAPLSDLVYEKTAGNPFFAIQFLTTLYDEHLLEYDGCTNSFRWDLAKIRAKRFTDNVVDLMVAKLRRFPVDTQLALQHLACLGNGADINDVALVCGGSRSLAQAELWEAVQAGLVLREGDSYKFLHDRVQEAAYALVPEERRPHVHLRIGRLLLSRVSEKEIPEIVFDVVSHLNRGVALIEGCEERERVAELNLLAGERAKASTAYVSALSYLAFGASLLEEGSWDRRYELAFALELGRAQCEYLTGEYAAAEERLSRLMRRARGTVDIAAVTCARVVLYTTLVQSDRAVEVVLEYLVREGIRWSPHPAFEEVLREYEGMWSRLGDTAIEALTELPAATDPASCATMDVLTWSLGPALYTDDNLHCLIVARMASLSLERGNSEGSCYGYIRLGMLLGPRFGDYQAAFRFAKVGLELVERRDLLRFKAAAYLDFGHLITPWTRHVRTGVDLVRRSFVTAQETGNLTYASYARNCLVTAMLTMGDPLGEVQREAESALAFVRTAKFGLPIDVITAQRMFVRALRGLTVDFGSLDDAQFDEQEFEQHLQDSGLPIATCWYWIRKSQARYFAGDYAQAVAAASKAQPLLWSSPSFPEVAEWHFYRALALAAHHEDMPPEERQGSMEALAAHHRQLAAWAANAPENFENRAALVGAEIARLRKEPENAAQLYERAIRSARDNAFVQNEAVAYEAAARFYRARGFDLFADAHVQEAHARYRRWGADGKVKQLERLHPSLVEGRPSGLAERLAMCPSELDLLSVTKASQAISEEIVLDKLLLTLLGVVLVHGGAQTGYLVLCQGRRLTIEAEARLEETGVATRVLGSLPLGSSGRIPSSLARYVQRTKQRVLLDDADAAGDAGKFSDDEYFAKHRPKSVLCMPIVRQSNVVGVLYLENDLLAGAFTSNRLAALELLAAQAAISLQNARLLTEEQGARAVAEDAERRAAFVADATILLSESLGYEDTLDRLGRLCVHSLADWCVIDIVEGGDIRRVAGAHADAEKEALLKELQRRYPLRWESAHPATEVLRTGKPFVSADLSEELLRPMCDDEEHLQLLRELGLQALLVLSLVARGQTLGTLSLVSATRERRFERVDLDLAGEVALRAATAIDNARLYRASQEAVRARNDFLSVASHELNTPLTSLLLALQRLRQLASPQVCARSPDHFRSVLELASRQGTRLSRLVNDLLDVSRLEQGRVAHQPEGVELCALVREVLERFEGDLARAGSPVSMQGHAPVLGEWDRSHVDRIVTNLLSNAIKFGRGKPIEVIVSAEGGVARLIVRDQGLGIEQGQIERIFGRFERAVSAKHYAGLGLGLYISRKLVEAHGGSIRCESQAGVGSIFIVELPCTGACKSA
jgi:predicted ATPase/signal transduction histidine kinase/tRNA A-37 threonylcarbamoyl transferase component Bud32